MTVAITAAPYGSWKSPISSDLIVSSSIRLGAIAIDNGFVYWNEGRPKEGGRNVIMRYKLDENNPDGNYQEMTPATLNVRSLVHEYGGGEYLVDDGRIYFSNFSDRCIYRKVGDGEPQALTQVNQYRYADFVWSRLYGKLICVREDHTAGGEPINTLVAVNTSNGEDIQVLAAGADFYASPCLNPAGDKLAWINWQHPNMPWDGTELWVADLVETEVGILELQNSQLVAGGVSESIFQPRWSADGKLYFVSDRTGWWNLYRKSPEDQNIQALHPIAAEFGLPQWNFGMSTYDFTGDGKLLCSYSQHGQSHLAILDPNDLDAGLQNIELLFTSISGVHCEGDYAVFHGGSATEPTAIVLLDVKKGTWQKIRAASDLQIDPAYISAAKPVEFPTENGKTAYGLFYTPKNKDFQGESNEKPPLLVKSHGGPTASTSGSLSLGIQYWTSRGFAVLDVNYGGSTGYGREYRDRLKGNWGIVDVDDCANGAKFLADQGLVDGDRLAISGGSAGGYTTLCALTFRDDFKAGASHYGICDLEALATDTHKFESRYLDSLIGKYPEQKELYIQRSPIHFTEKLSCAIAFFQGLEDKVVPPNQAEMMVNALRQKGLPVAYVPFEGEQHGFRKAENIKRALDGEFYFYSQIFGFTPADVIEAIAIENM